MNPINPVQDALVLVVDDQPANLQALGTMLTRAGHEVMPATSGEQALARARVRKPDLVILDLLMPGMDGVAVCRELRKNPALAEVPVIFLTAATERGSLVSAFESGAVDYLTKPFLAEELLARVATHIKLKRAHDHLRQIARERDDVTAIVAHDLKNPLANIRFAAQMLRRPEVTAERRLRLAADIVACCDEAVGFIHRYLSHREQTERVREFHLAPVDLRELIERVVALQALAAETKSVRLVCSGPPLCALADAAVLRNVLQNLLSNAIRFAPSGSAVEVRLDDSRAGHARVYVSDAGPGIPESERRRLFQRFARLAQPGSIDDEADYSTGLGLAIAKGDIERMHGFLWFEPRPGGGSLFAFELPLAQVEQTSAARA